MSFTLAIFSSALLFLSTHAQNVPPKELLKDFSEKDFKPHMIDHFNQGCPTNSACSKQSGLHYQSWLDILKKKNNWKQVEEFRRKKGIPIEVWSTSQSLKSKGIIHWDSPCPKHNPKDETKKLMTSLAMARSLKDLSSLIKGKLIYLREAYLKKAKGGIQKYNLPRGMGPLFIKGEQLIYTKESDGVYYGLALNKKGELKILPPDQTTFFPKAVQCPKDLIKKFSKSSRPSHLYQGLYCQGLWNKEQKSYETMIYGWSCD